MIQTLAKATEDKKREAEVKRITKKEEPLVTKVFPVSYAETNQLQGLLKEYTTRGRGSIGIDERTNSLIVKDTALVIEKN